MVALDELAPLLQLLARREGQVHPEHLAFFPQVALGMTVTIQTPAHRHRLFLPCQRHLVDSPVTRNATHPLLNVDRVMEVHEVRKVVHPGPDEGLVLAPGWS